TSAIATTPNDTACVIDGSNTTYQTSVVAATMRIEVTSAIDGPNSRRRRRCRTKRPAAITANDEMFTARTYAPVRPRAPPASGAARPAARPTDSTAATARYAGAHTIAGPIGTTWCGRG